MEGGDLTRDPGQGNIMRYRAHMHRLRALGAARLATTTHRSNRLRGALQAGRYEFSDKYPLLPFSGGFSQCFARETLETAIQCRLLASPRLEALLEQC